MTCREAEPSALDWLQTYDPQWTDLHNRLHRHRQPWQGQFLDQPISVQWSTATQAVEPLFDIHLALGETTVVLQMPAQALEASGQAGHGLEALEGLAGSMLLELALLSLIEPLEQLSGHSIRVLDQSGRADAATISAAFPLALMLRVQLAQGSPWTLPLRMNAESASLIAGLFDQYVTPTPQPVAAVRVPLTVDSGEAQLSLAELRSLRPGDVLMLDDWPAAQVRLVLAHRLQARADRKGDTLILLESLTAVSFLKETPMTETAVGPSPDATLDELPLTVVCQVGSVEMSLAQLRELGAGSLLPLAPRLHDGVDLMVNGRRVGQGQLVKIGDGLGVRVLSFASA